MRNRYFLVTSFPGQRRDWRRVGVGGCLSLFFQGNGHFQGLLGLLHGLSFCPFSRPPERFSTAFPGLFTVSGAFLHVMASGSFLHGLSFCPFSRPPDRFSTAFPGLPFRSPRLSFMSWPPERFSTAFRAFSLQPSRGFRPAPSVRPPAETISSRPSCRRRRAR